MSRGRLAVAGSLVLLLGLGMFISLQSRNAVPEQRPSGRLAPAEGALFGSFQAPPNGAMAEPTAAWDSASLIAATEAREGDLGRVQDVSHWLYAWENNGSWPAWREHYNVDKGRIPMVSWGGTKTAEINAGVHDAAIRAQAAKVARFRTPMFLRWFWEMDATENADRAGTPEAFIAAWQRIHTMFGKRGADNAIWVWCPTAWGFTNGKAPAYYPGDAYVDWVCADGFNWYPGRDNTRWQSFEWIFRPFYDWAMRRSKPLMAGTYGVQEDPADPGRKAAWFAETTATLKTSMTGFAGAFYYDTARDHDWRVDTSPAAYEAYIRMAQDPWFNVTSSGRDTATRTGSSAQEN